jgi:1-acyl-sn-glycerol-3-phosphate acyltransferase
MPGTSDYSAKPRSQVFHKGLTRLPALTSRRRIIRWFLRGLARFLVAVLTRVQASGLENLPSHGPVLVVANHLGDADVVVGLAYVPVKFDAVAKVELYDFPVLGALMEAFGVIWIHRGQPDRQALRCVLDGLEEGRVIYIAPEGRESITGSLEEGTEGAAYLALKAGVPLIPMTFTGTENRRVFANLKRLRRTSITLTVGSPFILEPLPDWRESVRIGTQTIMTKLAEQLPAEYRGVYR